MTIDKAKYEYFLAKYKAIDQEELHELAARGGSLAEEARKALREVCSPVGIEIAQEPIMEERSRSLTVDQMENEKARSSELWNSSLAKRVEYLIAAQALMFASTLLGPWGLKTGDLLVVIVAGVLAYAAKKAGRSFTRKVCANAEVSIEEKTKSLKITSYMLWPALLVASFFGITIAALMRVA